MSFIKYPVDPISPNVQAEIDKHYKHIRDHSAMLVNAGIAAEEDRVTSLLNSIAAAIMSEVLDAGMSYKDADAVDEDGLNLEGRIANLISDMLDY